jgi:hypothetical protein
LGFGSLLGRRGKCVGGMMLSQHHQFRTDEEAHLFERVFFQFMGVLEHEQGHNDDCLFMTHRKDAELQTITVKATSTTILEAFNAHLANNALQEQDAMTAV